MRLLDCKVEECKAIYEKPEVKAVITSDFVCPECHEHFESVKKYLDVLGIKYSVNKLLVRGLDYYNRTVFEIKSNNFVNVVLSITIGVCSPLNTMQCSL